MKQTAVSQRSVQALRRPRFASENLCLIPLEPTCAARAARNIATWREYLPTDCVRTMIRMGWDYTT
jgi:hypothetical protein